MKPNQCYEGTLLRSRGIGIIELMVGLVVALVATVVIFQVLLTSEGYRRTTVAGANATDNASFALFALERTVSWAGSGLARTPGVWGCRLALTRRGAAVLPAPSAHPSPFNGLPQAVRAAPILIRDGGAAAPDTLLLLASTSPTVGAAVPVDGIPGSDSASILTTTGFTAGDLVVAIDRVRAGADCDIVQVTNAMVPSAAAGTAPTIMNPLSFARAVVRPAAGLHGYSSNTVLLNLGASPMLVAFGVGPDASDGRPSALLRYDLIAGGAPVAFADNIVNLQALYGVAATSGRDAVTQWVAATGEWSIDALTDGSVGAADRIARLRGVRLAIIARSATEERDAVSSATWTLFADVPSATVTGTLDAAATHYRYKTFESTLALRNMLVAND